MIRFLKAVLSKFFSTVVAFILFVGLLIYLFSKIGESAHQPLVDNSVLHLVLNGSIADYSDEKMINFEDKEILNITKIEQVLAIAAKDKKIRAMYIEVQDVDASIGVCERLRKILLHFKSSGKPIYTYADDYSLLNYYAISGSNEIILHPLGTIEWKGLSAQMLYFKSLLSSMGIQVEPIKAGKYKSAIEPFISDTLGGENEFQVRALIQQFWTKIKNDVSTSRKVSVQDLNLYADSLGVLISAEAKSKKLITQIAHRDAVILALQAKFGKVELASYQNYEALVGKEKSGGASKIAVWYAQGNISNDASDDEISSQGCQKILEEIAKDKSIKALLIRINSPGGSASASESIWRQIHLLRKKMPVYVSMGDVAASGGYYMACAADSIFAESTSITGSIGVFGLMFNLEKLKNKLGVSVEKVSTNRLSDFPAYDRPLSKLEKQRMQMGVDSIYSLFLKRVADSRKCTVAHAHELAQGRVWGGSEAKKVGLVDGIKSLNEVLVLMGKNLSIKNYQVVEFPERKSPLEKVISKIDNKIALQWPEPFSYLSKISQHLESCESFIKPQCRLPFSLEIK